MNIFLLFAILSPLAFATVNIIDSYIVKTKVRNVAGFIVCSGIAYTAIGLVLAFFLDWNYSIKQLIFPALSGIMFGAQTYLYYYAVSKSDISNNVGFYYIYPLFVALLSFVFLNERFSVLGYFGILITLSGIFMYLVNFRKLKLTNVVWLLLFTALCGALYEFFIKIATYQVQELNGVAINSIFIGMILLLSLSKRTFRKAFRKEFRNVGFSFIIESFALLGIMFTYFAMKGLPATVVSVVSTIQPLFVLALEFTAFKFGLKMVADLNWKNKILSMTLIILGIIILYLHQ